MCKKIGCLVVLSMLLLLGALAWRPVSDFFADDSCLDSGGKVGPNHTCIH
jgi:hypothetical protein